LFEPSLKPLHNPSSEFVVEYNLEGLLIDNSKGQEASVINVTSTTNNNNSMLNVTSTVSDSLSGRSGCGRVASAAAISKMKGKGWLATVDQLIVDSAYLTSLKPLILDLSALRVVSFRNNRLNNSCLGDLGTYCPNLEEICLENNHLDSLIELWRELADQFELENNENNNLTSARYTSSMNPLIANSNTPAPSSSTSTSGFAHQAQVSVIRPNGWFRHLKKFDCGHNNLTNLDDLTCKNINNPVTPSSASTPNRMQMSGRGASGGGGGGGMGVNGLILTSGFGLDRLGQLSLESNHIRTLAPIRSLVNLMELYMGNNDIAELAEIDHLKVNVYVSLFYS
jgi:hypothetical protein